MDRVACHIVYVSQDAQETRLIRPPAQEYATIADSFMHAAEPRHLMQNILSLLEVFGHVHVCHNGSECLAKTLQLQDSLLDLRPIIVLIDIPYNEHSFSDSSRSRSPSPSSPGEAVIQSPNENVHGLKLLQRIISESHLRNLSKLVVPISVLSMADRGDATVSGGIGSAAAFSPGPVHVFSWTNSRPDDKSFPTPSHDLLNNHSHLVRKCLDLGAVDVIVSPMSAKSVTSLEICAYRAYRDASKDHNAVADIRHGRKLSWVGVNDSKPFAYLREAMVSSLMKHICRFRESEDRVGNIRLAISSDRRVAISTAIGQWTFCAHHFSDDELVVAAMNMFNHALDTPGLEKWRLPDDQLINFLVACRAAYNNFVPFHNFRHVVDVLQATFHFLVRLGILPPYQHSPELVTTANAGEKSALASVLGPFEALTLLITAIGHDVGHPGVNNGFLITLNAPLAQLYNDRSVLESFHCAAFSQILRRYWPAAFEAPDMRRLMISSILATDMGIHFEYMKKLDSIQARLDANMTTDGSNDCFLAEQKSLACCLLIKCADISNVARVHDTALQWMRVLSDEFSRQATMEGELQIPTSLLSVPKKDGRSLARAQLGFMNLFAIPLFQAVVKVMPALMYTVDELGRNKELFTTKAEAQRPLPPRLGEREKPTSRLLARASATASCLDERSSDVAAKPSKEVTIIRPMLDAQGPILCFSSSKNIDQTNGIQAHTSPSRPSGRLSAAEKAQEVMYDLPSIRARNSETSDGSTSAPHSGDRASQSTTTGKLRLSPSSKNTSILSRQSSRCLNTAATSMPPRRASQKIVQQLRDVINERMHDHGSESIASPAPGAREWEEAGLTGRLANKPDRRGLRRRPSRFLSFFRRYRSSSSPHPSADAAF